MTDYEDYETARKNLKKAEETSNLESEEDSRKRKLPTRLISESESGTDIDSDIEDKKNLHQFLFNVSYLVQLNTPVSYTVHISILKQLMLLHF